jgi:hypothetical protein
MMTNELGGPAHAGATYVFVFGSIFVQHCPSSVL